MASLIRCAAPSASGTMGLNGPTLNSKHGVANSSARSSIFGESFSSQLSRCSAVSGCPNRPQASPPSLICVAVVWWSDASREIQPAWKKVHKMRVEKLNASQSVDNVPPVGINEVPLWEHLKSGAGRLFSAGFTPEVVIGRTAMLGFLSATTVEFETGKSVLEQLTLRGDIFAAVLAAGVLLMSLQRKGDDGPDFLSRPSRVFTPTAERLNGQAAMLGFALLVVVESTKGSALF